MHYIQDRDGSCRDNGSQLKGVGLGRGRHLHHFWWVPGIGPLDMFQSIEQKCQVFHLRCLCRILGIMWQDKVPNNDVFLRADIPSMFKLLHQCCLCWLGHVHMMVDGCIPKDLLYGELTIGARCRGLPQLRFKDICKRDMESCNIGTKLWESLTDDRNLWKQQVSKGLKSGEAAICVKNDARRARRIACHQQDQPDPQPASVFIC